MPTPHFRLLVYGSVPLEAFRRELPDWPASRCIRAVGRPISSLPPDSHHVSEDRTKTPTRFCDTKKYHIQDNPRDVLGNAARVLFVRG
jgi:hypothetical protein